MSEHQPHLADCDGVWPCSCVTRVPGIEPTEAMRREMRVSDFNITAASAAALGHLSDDEAMTATSARRDWAIVNAWLLMRHRHVHPLIRDAIRRWIAYGKQETAASTASPLSESDVIAAAIDVATNEGLDNDWECVRASDLDRLRAALGLTTGDRDVPE